MFIGIIQEFRKVDTPFSAFTQRYNGIAYVIANKYIALKNKKARSCRAIWDTGAEKTTIIQEIADEIGCIATDKAMMKGVGSPPK